MPATPAPSWVPFGQALVPLPAGNFWDAIKMRADLGKAVLDQLGDKAGPVIYDSWGEMVYFLVPAGSSLRWEAPNTWARGTASWVPIPGLEATTGPHWLVPPDISGRLTGLDDLRAAFEAATEETKPRPPLPR